MTEAILIRVRLKCCACRGSFASAFQKCYANHSAKPSFVMGMTNGFLDHTRVDYSLR